MSSQKQKSEALMIVMLANMPWVCNAWLMLVPAKELADGSCMVNYEDAARVGIVCMN